MNLKTWARATFYLVVDLEATTSEGGRAFPKQEMEAIEIGAVLLRASTLSIVDEFQIFVRPIRHPVLLPFCTALTGIQQADVDAAQLFPEAFAKLRERMIVGRERVVWGSWGQFDADQLRQDCELHRVAYEMPPHLNLKEALSEAQGWRRRFGMANALTRCGLQLEGVHHRGIDDARNIARLLPWIVGDKRALKRDRRDQEKRRKQ